MLLVSHYMHNAQRSSEVTQQSNCRAVVGRRPSIKHRIDSSLIAFDLQVVFVENYTTDVTHSFAARSYIAVVGG